MVLIQKINQYYIPNVKRILHTANDSWKDRVSKEINGYGYGDLDLEQFRTIASGLADSSKSLRKKLVGGSLNMEWIDFKDSNHNKFSVPKFIFELVSNTRETYDFFNVKIFGKRVIEITFRNCVFKKFEDFHFANDQNVTFSNCIFEDTVYINSGNLINLIDSNIHHNLSASGCNIINWKINSDSYMMSVNLNAKQIAIYGGILKSDILLIDSEKLNIYDADINACSFKMSASNFSIKDSNFNFCDFSYIAYGNLQMQNFSFNSQFGNLSFLKISTLENSKIQHCQQTTTYSFPISLNDSYFSNLRNVEIYSLLSILKGYSSKVQIINSNDIKKSQDKIDEELSKHLMVIEQQRQYLNQKEANIKRNFENQKETVAKEMPHRKIKSLVYPKE